MAFKRSAVRSRLAPPLFKRPPFGAAFWFSGCIQSVFDPYSIRIRSVCTAALIIDAPAFAGARGLLVPRPLLIEPKQAGQDFIVGHPRAPVVAPAISVGHGLIEGLVRVIQPRRAGVVEVGQGALFQDRRRVGTDRQEAIGVAGDDFGDALHQIRRVQPVFAQGVEAGGGGGDVLRAGVGGVGGGGDVGVRPAGKGKVSKGVVPG